MGINLGKVVVGNLGGVVVWNSLSGDSKQQVCDVAKDVTNKVSYTLQRAYEADQQKRAREALNYLANPTPAPANPTVHFVPISGAESAVQVQNTQIEHPPVPVDIDNRWLKVIVPPAVIMIVGKRGSGKSVLAYRILELFRYTLRPYVIGVPDESRRHLPEWVELRKPLLKFLTKRLPSSTRHTFNTTPDRVTPVSLSLCHRA